MIHSMTSYAQCEHKADWGTLRWELRSVNHRYLELSFKIPEAFKELEFTYRDIIKTKLGRGKVDCQLRYEPSEQQLAKFAVNHELVDKLVSMCHELSEPVKAQQLASPMEILQWPGVIVAEKVDYSFLSEPSTQLFQETIDKLIDGRVREGEALKKLLSSRVSAMREQVHLVKQELPVIMQAQDQRIRGRFTELSLELDEARLEQEMVYFAQKTDVAEELDRLVVHLDELERILKKGGVVGRRLDFLMQELNREANTLGSKSVSSTAAQASVELKVLIEQIREQVQNLE